MIKLHLQSACYILHLLQQELFLAVWKHSTLRAGSGCHPAHIFHLIRIFIKVKEVQYIFPFFISKSIIHQANNEKWDYKFLFKFFKILDN